MKEIRLFPNPGAKLETTFCNILPNPIMDCEFPILIPGIESTLSIHRALLSSSHGENHFCSLFLYFED